MICFCTMGDLEEDFLRSFRNSPPQLPDCLPSYLPSDSDFGVSLWGITNLNVLKSSASPCLAPLCPQKTLEGRYNVLLIFVVWVPSSPSAMSSIWFNTFLYMNR